MVNEIIDGKYEIISKIGSGGTSIVYKAKRLADNREVAIKVIRDELENIRELERHFRLEAEALNKMSHRNVRRILGVGQWNDSLYMVTEYIDGKTLKEIVAEGPVSIKSAVDYALQIAAGIEHAHRKNIIHRDIKPQNIIVSTDGTVKIVDFGIARMTSQTTRTMAGKDVVGSVHYLSPEQARGGHVDARSDIYSFGILLYEMFTGKVPFQGDEPVSIAMQHINQIAEPPQSVNPDITQGINDIIVKCIQKNPDDRYQTASELREDLLLYVANPNGFNVMKAAKLKGRDAFDEEIAEEPIKIHRKTPVNASDVPVKKIKRDIKNDAEEKKIAKWQKNRKAIGIIGAIVASVLIIAIAVSIIFSSVLDKKYPEKAVPEISGLGEKAAIALLNMESFSKIDKIYIESGTVKEGNVIRTEPEEKSVVEVNTVIKVYISKGAKAIMAQNVIGKNVNEAEQILRDQGFLIKFQYVEDPEKQNGIVVEQSNSTEAIKQGETITLTIVRNIETITIVVPDLQGKTNIDDIKNQIISSGCQVGKINQVYVTDKTKLGVIWQSVKAGTQHMYLSGETAPQIIIDVDINVLKVNYKLMYEYEMPDNTEADFELLMYDTFGNQIGESTVFNSTNKVRYEYNSDEPITVMIELYKNHLLVDKKTVTAVLENSDE